MKKIKLRPFYLLVLLITTCTIFFYSCKKKENTDTPVEVTPSHCSNGIIDQGELDTDCGGQCTPCAAIVAPCESILINNIVKLYSFPDMSITFVTAGMVSGNYTIVGNSSNGDITITLSGAAPTVDRAYYFVNGTGPSSILAEGQANIQMSKGAAGSFYPSGGKLYASIKNGKIEITFCNITFTSDQTSGTSTGYGKVTTM